LSSSSSSSSFFTFFSMLSVEPEEYRIGMIQQHVRDSNKRMSRAERIASNTILCDIPIFFSAPASSVTFSVSSPSSLSVSSSLSSTGGGTEVVLTATVKNKSTRNKQAKTRKATNQQTNKQTSNNEYVMMRRVNDSKLDARTDRLRGNRSIFDGSCHHVPGAISSSPSESSTFSSTSSSVMSTGAVTALL
jgi:hypothetical protein